MAYTPAASITLPVTITIGDLSCEAGTITVDAGKAGSIRREIATFLREAADIYEQSTAEEVTTP
ncbi:hypothetical protein [Streptomyces sp. NPDC096095]|uniref:hypothetical protein n=1 Tax=Streptomyces sp. NPDC096095 TaxID=3155545 RepID=UPI003323D2DB